MILYLHELLMWNTNFHIIIILFNQVHNIKLLLEMRKFNYMGQVPPLSDSLQNN